MKQAVMKKWVRALRSGKYGQTKARLKNTGNGYCCLGVLCEISKLDKFKKSSTSSNPSYFGNFTSLPQKVLNWSGMKTESGFFRGTANNIVEFPEDLKNSDYHTLAELNDNGATFKQIAKIIENKWRSL